MYIKSKYIIFILIAFNWLFSQSIIKGIVKDSQTKNPLIGANVFIEEIEVGSPSDVDGAYLISNIPACETCKYTLKVLYIGYKEYSTEILIDIEKEYTLDLFIDPSSLEVETTTVTAKKRVDKITDAPASIELVSAKDIKREESTNLGGYLKGLKGVDFTASGVNNYSISVRGFNSSFSSRLLTLTDGRVASIPALRVVNYSTVPQSSKDIESIEVVIGPATALYGANAHSGVVNITSKSPAVSEGIDVSASSSINDDRDLYKFSTRWAHKLNDKLSFKLSGMYLQAYEWEFISDEEYKRHKYPWNGNPARTIDKKDNNPWGLTTHYWELVAKDTTYRNYYTGDADIEYDVYVDDINDCRVIEGYNCEMIEKYIGDGEPNDTGDPDNDGVMGEDWYNGYDDDGDGLIDEDYFFADGIDNDGDCPGDTNGDGIVCGTGDEGVDELIDWSSDTWIDGADNNNNGSEDEAEEMYTGDFDRFNLPNWHYDMEFDDIIVNNGRSNDIFVDKYGNQTVNIWYNENDPHIRGTHIYDEENVTLLFDTFIYDFGDDGIPGDNEFIDSFGDSQFTPWEGNNILNGNLIPTEGCYENSLTGDGICTESEFDLFYDCGIDGLCPGSQGYTEPDYGEGNGIFDSFDWDGDGTYSYGDEWESNSWIDDGDGEPDLNDVITWNDTYPFENGQWDEGEQILDYGQDGLPNTNDPGEDDGILVFLDSNELDGTYDTGDNCFGCFNAESFEDLNNNGRYDKNEPYEDTNNDGIYTPADYKDEFRTTYDINGDGYDDYPDFEVKNSKTEIRFDYDPNDDINLTYQSGYSVSKTNQVSGVGRYLADNYEYTYYQLRGRYKNWFSQLYINQGNSGDTRGYMLGDMIQDESRNIAFQLQNNFKFNNTKVVWGLDYFRTEANTNGTVLNDGPNGYDNDGDSWFTGNDNIDNDRDSDDFSDWGIDGIGPYLTDEYGGLIIDSCSSCEAIVNSQAENASYDSKYDLWFIDEDNDGQWTTNNEYYPFLPNPDYSGPDQGEGNGIPDPGEPGVNYAGLVVVDSIDNDCDGCDYDNDGYPNFQEIQLNTNIYDPTEFPSAVEPLSEFIAYDELIDEQHCGSMQYTPYVDASNVSGYRQGRLWKCEEGIDENDEYEPIISNEVGFYFQTKTVPKRNKKFEIITAARFDKHDMLDEGIQFSPKFGIFYKPNNFQTFRMTYGKAFNTPTAINLATDLFIGKRGFVDYYLRGNTNGTPYQRVGDEFVSSSPSIKINNELYNLVNITGGQSADYWNGYTDRIDGAVYFLGFNTDFSDVPEFMPLDTALYTIWVPELADSGRIYTTEEALNIRDVAPIKTEKIQTFEVGFKGFLTERIHASVDYYVSLYEDFFSAPTIITPLIIKRQFKDNIDITNFDNIEVVGLLPANYNGGNAPFATQWDGRDNDFDWHCGPDSNCPYKNYGYFENDDDTTPEYGLDWYDLFNWQGIEEPYTDSNENGMWDPNEQFEDLDNSGFWNCINCSGEWGYIDWRTTNNGTDTLGYTIRHPQDVINTAVAMESGAITFGDNGPQAQYWTPVGVDEYSAVSGLSEAEYIESPLIGVDGNPIVAPGFAYTPLQSVLAPMNYGEVTMQGIDLGLTYLIPQSNMAIDANFSFYNTTEYFNTLTLQNDPINAPKFKMNASVNWESPVGNFSFKYRHVDQFRWADGIWVGVIGPYDLFDVYYNYKINKHLEFNMTGLNIFDDRHKEMIGGAVMGRQIIMRLSASI